MKTIKRFDCYLINKNGVVFSKITGKELKPFLRKGYLCVCLYNFGVKCINLAERDGFNNSLIVRCCKGLRKKHKGYEWKYKR